MGTYGEESREFKFEIIRLHLEDGIAIKVLSKQFSIPQSTIFGWRAQYGKYGEDAFVGCGRQRPDDAELRRLRKENERLRMENEILKKVAAYQAQMEQEGR
jgi:transposase